MTQVLKQGRATRSILLVVLMVAPGLLMLGAGQSQVTPPTTCQSTISKITTTPFYAVGDETVTVQVNVAATQGSGQVKAKLTVINPGPTTVIDHTIVSVNVPGTFSRSFTAGGQGQGKVEVELLGALDPNVATGTPPAPPSDYCPPAPDPQNHPDLTWHWGYWVDSTVDLRVNGDLTFFQHIDAADPQADVHNPFDADHRYTRYPDTGPTPPNAGTQCLEQSTAVPSRMHVSVPIRNDGNGGFFAVAEADNSLQLRVRVLDGVLPIHTGVYNFSVGSSKDRNLLLTGFNYSLLNKVGPRPLQVILDPALPGKPQGDWLESDETNNAGPVDPVATPPLFIRGPDLTAEFVGDIIKETDGNISGTMRMRNSASATEGSGAGDIAGAPGTPNPDLANICHSRDGAPISIKVYDSVVDDAHLIKSDNSTRFLAPGAQTNELSFKTTKPFKAGAHSLIAVADGKPLVIAFNDDANELNETNNQAVKSCSDVAALCVPDLRTPAISGIATVAANGFRVGAAINISGTITDDADFVDTVHNAVLVNVTYPNTTTFSYTVTQNPATSPTGASSGVVASNITDQYTFWWNLSYPEAGEYKFTVAAVDALHSATSLLQNFSLLAFPKNVENVTAMVCDTTTPASATQTNDVATYQLDNTAACSLGHHAFVPTTLTNATVGDATLAGNYLHLWWRVPPGATGLVDEFSNAARKTVLITDPDNKQSNFSVKAMCWAVTAENTTSATTCNAGQPAPNGQIVGASTFPCSAPATSCYNYTFDLFVGLNFEPNGVPNGNDLGCNPPTTAHAPKYRFNRPGPYNVTLYVGDVASPCVSRANGLPNRPLYTFELWATPNTTIRQTSITNHPNNAANALEPLLFRTNVSSTISAGTVPGIERAAIDVYWPNGTYLGAFNMTAGADVNRTTGNGTYNLNLSTGLGSSLDLAGTYKWLVAVRDANHTWSYSNSSEAACAPTAQPCTPVQQSLILQDTRTPTVTDAHVGLSDGSRRDGDAFEIGDNITIQANLDDDTRITAQGVFQNANGTELLRLNMTRIGGQVWRTPVVATGNGTAFPEGSYRFLVHVTDSVGNAPTETPAPFRIAGNLPPAFLGLTPADAGYAKKGGTLSFDVSDEATGVNVDSITVRAGKGAATQNMTAVKSPSSGTAKLVHVTVQLTGFDHGDNVTVNVSAADAGGLQSSRQWSFAVDGAPPVSTLTCTHSLPVACGSQPTATLRADSVVSIGATDADPKVTSGVKAIRYTLESGGQVQSQEVLGANATFSLGQQGRPDGLYRLNYRAIDGAGNEEVGHPLDLVLDTQGPLVTNVVRAQTSGGANISATISDTASDVAGAKLFFRTDVTGYESRPMTRLGDSRFWFAELAGARRGVRLCYYIEASDGLENTAFNGTAAAPECFTAENHPPSLTVLEPAEGDAVGNSMTVRWQSSDIDGDPVTVSLALRRAGDVQLRSIPLTSEDQGRRTRTVDTTDLVAGTYQLRIDAVDNQVFNNRTTRTLNVSIGGPAGTTLEPTFDKPTISLGEEVKVRVEILRPVADIQARLLRDGNVVDRQPMDQEPPGSKFYVATFRVTEPGVYRVDVVGEYEDGTPFTLQGATTLTVRGGSPVELDTAVILLLAAAVVALAVVGLRRRGW